MPCALKARIEDDVKQALRSGDQVRLSAVRMLLSAVNYAEKAKMAELDDAGVVGVVAREIKQHKESIEAFKNGNRPEMAVKEEAELVVLQAYMPQQMSRAEISELVKKIAAEVGAQGPHDKGKVMSRLMPQVRGKADGQEVNAVVTELLGR
ncbi:MAG: GatB/YqeY domain-containing protein [Dehalococcoidia bacterium]|nr:GatB/YqeY domain-containing protein [Dehalococcoidia bacterium]